jgi:hypothetical protein
MRRGSIGRGAELILRVRLPPDHKPPPEYGTPSVRFGLT